jgi:hypothetical protein
VTAAPTTHALYVYAIVDAVPDSLGLGLDGAPLRALESGRVAAVVGEHGCPAEPDEDKLWTHEAMVERLMEAAAVLPLRFGTTVTGEAELRAWLEAHEGELTTQLEAVRGAVEVSVRAELPAVKGNPDPTPGAREAASGTEYMRRRGQSIRADARARERLHEPLDALARRAVLFGPGVRAEQFRAAYLVDDERVEAFAAEVDRLAHELELEVSCTGPWPPYSFVAEVGR